MAPTLLLRVKVTEIADAACVHKFALKNLKEQREFQIVQRKETLQRMLTGWISSADGEGWLTGRGRETRGCGQITPRSSEGWPDRGRGRDERIGPEAKYVLVQSNLRAMGSGMAARGKEQLDGGGARDNRESRVVRVL
ncbi:hypothetical protein K0M31_011519 [Melipona bicolor]|uniref:Uncharacterized protein n=1 Tax=Melipona bicolor TaxID=60889 RepID=A0AA40G9Q0_9HYME|nr:hypothetical protein K0M31_011519 [Melipona bicolor]